VDTWGMVQENVEVEDRVPVEVRVRVVKLTSVRPLSWVVMYWEEDSGDGGLDDVSSLMALALLGLDKLTFIQYGLKYSPEEGAMV